MTTRYIKDRFDLVHKTPRIDHNKKLWAISKYGGGKQQSAQRLRQRKQSPPLVLQHERQQRQQKQASSSKQQQQQQPSSSSSSSAQVQVPSPPPPPQRLRQRKPSPPIQLPRQHTTDDDPVTTFTYRKRGEYTINDHNPFLYWWHEHKDDYSADAPLNLDYNDPTTGFWQEFDAVVNKWGAEHQSILPYLRSRDAKKSQSLNAVFRKHGWKVTPAKRGNTVIKGQFVAVPTKPSPAVSIFTHESDYQTHR